MKGFFDVVTALISVGVIGYAVVEIVTATNPTLAFMASCLLLFGAIGLIDCVEHH